MKFAGQEIVEEKYFGIAAVFNGFGSLENIITKTIAYEVNGQEHGRYQEQRLQTIGNNNGF